MSAFKEHVLQEDKSPPDFEGTRKMLPCFRGKKLFVSCGTPELV